MNQLPEPLQNLVDQLSQLPGLGPKSALRMALTILKWPENRARDLGKAVYELRDRLCFCERCNGLADSSPCSLCSDLSRDPAQLVLVAEWDSLLAMENGGFFRGHYMILGGLLDPLEGGGPSGLELDRLKSRLAEGEVRELILGLGTTMDAENTASYIHSLVSGEFPEVKVTRLAQGIPLGAEVKYVDKETLKQSLLHRQSF